jgi:hypothetical protein
MPQIHTIINTLLGRGHDPKAHPPAEPMQPLDEAKDIIASMIMVTEKARREGPGVYKGEWYRTTMKRAGNFMEASR